MDDFTEIPDIKEELADLNNKMNSLAKIVHNIFTFKYYLLIYKLIEQGKVGPSDIAECTGQDKSTVYYIHSKVKNYLSQKDE